MRNTVTAGRASRPRFWGRMVVMGAVIVAAALRSSVTPASASGYSWLQFDGNSQHSGDNTAESELSLSTVSGLTKAFSVSLPSIADGAPAYLSGVSTSSGTQNLVFLTTKDGHILALNARTGAQVWSQQYGPNGCTINQSGSTPCYTTSSPAIDPNHKYVYSYGLDGYVHKYAVGTGVESTGSGWPELSTTKPYNEKGSSALSTATAANGVNYLYMASSGYPGDQGDYQGHITTINLGNGVQHVFNADCSNSVNEHFVETPGSPDCDQVQSAVWSRPGVVYDKTLNRMYGVTGNGVFSPSSYDWGDTVFALSPNGLGALNPQGQPTGDPLDTYTPANYATLNSTDQDLGSTAPAILPPSSASADELGVQGGKDQMLRLINLGNLSGQGSVGNTGGEIGTPISVPQGGQVLSQPAVWVNPADNSDWVFVTTADGISALKLVSSAGTPALQTMWQGSVGGSSPLIANGVLYYAGNHDIQAMDPTTGQVLWHNTSIGNIHWESPIVVNGMLYITDESQNLTAFKLRATPTATPTATTTP